MFIRPVKIEDVSDIFNYSTKKEVYENMVLMPTDRIEKFRHYISTMGINDHAIVCEVNENGFKKVISLSTLHVNLSPRMKHSATLSISVDPEYQRRGVGRLMISRLLDIGDNLLMLKRIELSVLIDNLHAIKLYKSLGFEIEGTKKYSVIKNGTYVDEYIMARYK